MFSTVCFDDRHAYLTLRGLNSSDFYSLLDELKTRINIASRDYEPSHRHWKIHIMELTTLISILSRHRQDYALSQCWAKQNEIIKKYENVDIVKELNNTLDAILSDINYRAVPT